MINASVSERFDRCAPSREVMAILDGWSFGAKGPGEPVLLTRLKDVIEARGARSLRRAAFASRRHAQQPLSDATSCCPTVRASCHCDFAMLGDLVVTPAAKAHSLARSLSGK